MTQHKISWLNMPGYKPETWNPIVGCSKVSPGCDNCYAEKMAFRLANIDSVSDKYITVVDFSTKKWNGYTNFESAELYKPKSWKNPRMIFVCSMGDLFHETVSHERLKQVFQIIHDNPQHIFIVLTKRPERMAKFFDKLSNGDVATNFPNVWLGVTAENQEQANKRIPILIQIPAEKRFVSIEPMLGAILLGNVKLPDTTGRGWNGEKGGYPYLNSLTGREFSVMVGNDTVHKLDWVICGGESGPKARPIHPDWVRSVRDQCAAAGTPFFFKQWGEWIAGDIFESDIVYNTYNGHPLPHLLQIDGHTIEFFKVGRKAAGDLLNGKQYHNWPNNS